MKSYFILFKSHRKVNDDDVNLLLVDAHNKNTKNQITGRLFSSETKFLQYLEGDYESVNEIYEKISKDIRNYAIQVVTFGYNYTRLFDNFISVFPVENSEDLNLLKTINFRSEGLTENGFFSEKNHIINEYLKDFYQEGDINYNNFWDKKSEENLEK